MLHIDGCHFAYDLVVLEMSLFDIVLGMDWFSLHEARIDCEKRKISLYHEPIVSFRADSELHQLLCIAKGTLLLFACQAKIGR